MSYTEVLLQVRIILTGGKEWLKSKQKLDQKGRL